MSEPKRSDPDSGWRVGRHQPRNIYCDGRFVAVAVGSEEEAAALAERICKVMNLVTG